MHPHNSSEIRLTRVRKQWRRDHPFGFFAKPVRTAQGVLDLKKWECGVPGKDKTLWEGGLFKLDVLFPDGESGRDSSHVYGADLAPRVSHKASEVYDIRSEPLGKAI